MLFKATESLEALSKLGKLGRVIQIGKILNKTGYGIN